MMKKILKWLGILLGVALLGLLVAWLVLNRPKPVPVQDASTADALARKMEQAVNKAAWDTTRYVGWTSRMGINYLWDKTDGKAIVAWSNKKVLLHTHTLTGEVLVDGQPEKDPVQQAELVQKAWELFANDSFWFCAPMKAFDPGTSRDLVDMEDGSKGLLVTYSKGGVTPGDTYLWILDETGLPKAWRMWVKILPVGGLEFTWEDWTPATGPRIALSHRASKFNASLKDVRFPIFEQGNNPFETF